MPAITVCSDQFIVLGRKQLKALSAEGHPIAVIPHPFGLRTRDEVRAIAEQCVADIARIAVDPKAGALAGGKAAGRPARAARIEAPEDADEFDKFCIDRKWSDGLPLRPPTLDKVERMIAASGRAPDEVVAVVQPGFGAATVEGIAINAVMAGCRPEYIRTLIAAVEAFTDRRFNLQGIQATTNPATAMILVNGPVAREIGVNGHLNCLGQGTWANATLGRALRLVMQNIGRALPGEMDRATHGQPALPFGTEDGDDEEGEDRHDGRDEEHLSRNAERWLECRNEGVERGRRRARAREIWWTEKRARAPSSRREDCRGFLPPGHTRGRCR